MALTSDALPVLLAIFAMALFGAIVIGPRHVMSRRRARVVLAAQTVGLNAVVLVLCGVLLNNTFDFYLSWSDLLGLRQPVVTARGGADPSRAAAAHLDRPEASRGVGTGSAPLPPLPRPGSRLQGYEVTGASSHLVGSVLVDLPRGYDPMARTHYPVIIALHGTPGEPRAWLGPMAFGTTIDAAVDDHELAAPILVMPQVNFPYSVDSECVNGPAGSPQVETWLTSDLPAWIVGHFRVSPDRTGWAVAGYSAGGWCAAMVAMRHPGLVGGALVFGGYFAPEFSPGYDPLVRSVTSAGRYDLITMAHVHPPAVALWVMTSKGDATSYPSTARFLRAARPPLSVTSWVARSGGHRFGLWVLAAPDGLRWLGRSLPGFAPS